MRGLFVTCFGVANLRFGAQLPIRGLARVSLILSLLIAIIAVAMAVRKATQPTGEPSRDDAAARSPARAWSLVAGQAIAVAVLALVLIDVHAHRRVETDFGVNQWGYRGPIQSVKHPGVRIAFVGGSVAFAAETPWAGTIAAQLASAVNGKQRWTRPGGPFASVDNLAEPAASADSYVATLRDYGYLDPDIVCVFDGYDAGTGGAAARGRRASLVFRSIGYLPMASTPLVDPAGSLSNPAGGVARASQDDGLPDAIDPSCAGSSAPYCAAIAETVRFVIQRRKAIVVATPPYVSARHEAQQRSLAEYLDRQFGHEPRFRYVNLGSIIDLRDRAQSADGLHLTVAASRTVAARLADALIPPIKHRGL